MTGSASSDACPLLADPLQAAGMPQGKQGLCHASTQKSGARRLHSNVSCKAASCCQHSVPCSNLCCAHPTCLNPAWEITVGDPGCCHAVQFQCSVVAQRKGYMGALCARAGLCFPWGDMILLIRASLCDVHLAVVWHAEDAFRMMHSCCLLTCFGSKATRRRGPCRTLLLSWL